MYTREELVTIVQNCNLLDELLKVIRIIKEFSADFKNADRFFFDKIARIRIIEISKGL